MSVPPPSVSAELLDNILNKRRKTGCQRGKNKNMVLARMQPVDLKKVFAKMEAREYSKLHRTTKWVHDFLEKNMGKHNIYTEKHTKALTMRIEKNNGELFLILRPQGGITPVALMLAPPHRFLTIEVDLPTCNTNFFLEYLEINYRGGQGGPGMPDSDYIDKFTLYLTEKGIKRVKQLVVKGMKPSQAMLDSWKPSFVQVSRYVVSTEDYWNALPELYQRQVNIGGSEVGNAFEVEFEKLGRLCQGVQLTVEVPGPTSKVLPRVASQIQKFVNDTTLKNLTMTLRVYLLDMENIIDFLPNPILPKITLDHEEKNIKRYYLYTAQRHLTFVVAEWSLQRPAQMRMEVNGQHLRTLREASRTLPCDVYHHIFESRCQLIPEDWGRHWVIPDSWKNHCGNNFSDCA